MNSFLNKRVRIGPVRPTAAQRALFAARSNAALVLVALREPVSINEQGLRPRRAA
jgi:hypothetical protein